MKRYFLKKENNVIEKQNVLAKQTNDNKRSGVITKGIIALICVAVISVAVCVIVLNVKNSEKTEVTNVVVEEKLSAIGELATCQMEYKDIKTEENTRRFFDLFDIPLTTNSIVVTYNGVIKVGYQFEDIKPEVDEMNKIILIRLPEAVVLSNEIDTETMEFIEHNNILNPISCDSITYMVQEIKVQELESAEEKGIFEMAKQQAKDLIKEELAGFEGYTIEFV